MVLERPRRQDVALVARPASPIRHGWRSSVHMNDWRRLLEDAGIKLSEVPSGIMGASGRGDARGAHCQRP